MKTKQNTLNLSNPNVLRDSLHNLSTRENGDNHEYGKGVFVGTIAFLMAMNYSWESAIAIALSYCPDIVTEQRIPPSWLDECRKHHKRIERKA